MPEAVVDAAIGPQGRAQAPLSVAEIFPQHIIIRQRPPPGPANARRCPDSLAREEAAAKQVSSSFQVSISWSGRCMGRASHMKGMRGTGMLRKYCKSDRGMRFGVHNGHVQLAQQV